MLDMGPRTIVEKIAKSNSTGSEYSLTTSTGLCRLSYLLFLFLFLFLFVFLFITTGKAVDVSYQRKSSRLDEKGTDDDRYRCCVHDSARLHYRHYRAIVHHRALLFKANLYDLGFTQLP